MRHAAAVLLACALLLGCTGGAGGAASATEPGDEAATGASVTVTGLRTEHLVDPLGLDKPQPRFGWELEAHGGARGVQQTSYRIVVVRRHGGSAARNGSAVEATTTTTWNTGVVASTRSHQVRYGGPSLVSHGVYHWTVTVTTKTRVAVQASATCTSEATATFSMGMLNKSVWRGEFIGLQSAAPGVDCPWFRKPFFLPENVVSETALMSVGSVGFHELWVNGQPASTGVLLPSASFLPRRVLYRTYNISKLLRPGQQNTLGVWAAPGWADWADMRCNHSFVRLHRSPLSKMMEIALKSMNSLHNLISRDDFLT